MFSFNLGDFPSKIKQDVAYILYYTFSAFIPVVLFVVIMSQQGLFPNKLTDYQFIIIVLVYSAIFGYFFWLATPSPEKQAIKKVHFIAGLIRVLSERGKLSFTELSDKYSYCVFGNSIIPLGRKDYTMIIIVLINLGVIELTNEKDFQKGPEKFNFKHFEKNISKMIFQLKSKNIDLDEVAQKVQRYLFN